MGQVKTYITFHHILKNNNKKYNKLILKVNFHNIHPTFMKIKKIIGFHSIPLRNFKLNINSKSIILISKKPSLSLQSIHNKKLLKKLSKKLMIPLKLINSLSLKNLH